MSVLAMRAAIDRGGVVRYQTLHGCEIWGEWYCCCEDGCAEYCSLVKTAVSALFGDAAQREIEHVLRLSNTSVEGTTYVRAVWGDEAATMQCIDYFLQDMSQAVAERFHPEMVCRKPLKSVPAMKMRYVPETDAHVLVSDDEWASLMSSLSNT